MKKLVVFSGAGMSAESGLKTFRDNGGLWENYRVEEVATPEAFEANPKLVLDFYNQRRKQLSKVSPNEGHIKISELENFFDVTVITQNIDNLHEIAGSTKVIHLHGELNKAESSRNPRLVYDLNFKDILIGDTCEEGFQLRPNVVWFGEAVPQMEVAMKVVSTAEIFVVVGTSLVVYPAASLINMVPKDCQIYVIDPEMPELRRQLKFTFIKEKASLGLAKLASQLTS